MESHPAANLFPLMGEQELQDLAADIQAHGLHEAITTYEGKILDGRNRLRACEIAGVSPRFVEWDGTGGSPTDYVVSLNLHRRHLTVSQLAMIAADSRPLYEAEARERQRGGRGGVLLPVEPQEAKPVETAVLAAQAFGIGEKRVYEAARVQRESPSLAEQVRAGEMGVDTAIREIKGIRRQRVYIPDKHKELVKRADHLTQLTGKWDRSMTDSLAPPEARKQLTVLNKALALLSEAVEAVEYRAATLHTFKDRG